MIPPLDNIISKNVDIFLSKDYSDKLLNMCSKMLINKNEIEKNCIHPTRLISVIFQVTKYYLMIIF
jgi:hypothetical protein